MAYPGLKANPFTLTPDPAYLYLSPSHQEALAHLLYGMEEEGGFVLLTGEVGTGKTMLVRTLLEQQHDHTDIALCLNPRLTEQELVAVICDELQIDYPRQGGTLKTLIDALNTHLLATHAQGRRTVLIIDEAQNLSHEVLEQVRLLTNLETRRCKLLRVILVGQPELQRVLASPQRRQVAQRITARYHLMPLNRKQTAAYIAHRLQIAGGGPALFTKGARKAVYCLTGGIPRLINIICDRALLGAYGQDPKQVTRKRLRQAVRELLPQPVLVRYLRFRLALGPLVLGTVAMVLAQLYLPGGLFANPPLPAWIASYLPARPAVSTAPAPRTLAVQETLPQATQPTPAIAITDYMRKGDRLMELRDFASARLFYSVAAKAGYAPAMTAVGKTYDPQVIDQGRLHGLYADPAQAAQWYRQAAKAGDLTAAEDLRRVTLMRESISQTQ